MNRSYPCASFWNSPRVKFINFIDYEEAIDNVDRQFILRQPRHYGKPENVINIIRKSHLTDGFELHALTFPAGNRKRHDDRKGSQANRNCVHTLEARREREDIIGTNFLTKFHEDWKINVASREKCPSHVVQPTGIIFELVQDIIDMDLLTTFHEDRTVNVASRVKNAPPLGNIIDTNLLTKFHEDWTINVASRLKNAPPLVTKFFYATKTIFELIQDIIGTNLLTKFHEDPKINVTTRVLTRFNIAIYGKIPRPRGGHVFQPTGIISKLVQDIIEMNLLTKFHEDRTIYVASIVKNSPPLGSHVFQAKQLTSKIAPPPGGHGFKESKTIFELVQEDIIQTNLPTMFNEDPKINVVSRVLTRLEINVAPRVLTRFYYTCTCSHIRKNAPHLGSHVFQANITIFELIQDIIGTNLLTMFNEDRKINEKCPAPWRLVFIPTGIIFQLIQNIRINLLTKFHEDRTINVTSRVKKAPPLDIHVFQGNLTIFKPIQDIIKTNL
ncbi:hypothetical protein DPMN_164650 [Dreissena polymorpha]|uniref:Uncharacterized protein n=1 Tax=Dreissena polymorpha TaxID=45954 RepID=A0A9D4IWA5_DREPO|nr:hypothetical protein DPMN_164650 [Dreissena polymorpha]